MKIMSSAGCDPVKKNTFRIRLSDRDLEKLHTYALKHNKTSSRVIREYIWRLPNLKENL